MKKKELSIEQKKADKDLNIIIYATLIPLIIYLIFGNDIMNFAKTSEMEYMAKIYTCYVGSI